MFYAQQNEDIVMILFIHVGDITITAQNITIIDLFKNSLSKFLEFTDGGELHWLLGIEIKQNHQNKMIMLQQKHYIKNILK